MCGFSALVWTPSLGLQFLSCFLKPSDSSHAQLFHVTWLFVQRDHSPSTHSLRRGDPLKLPAGWDPLHLAGPPHRGLSSHSSCHRRHLSPGVPRLIARLSPRVGPGYSVPVPVPGCSPQIVVIADLAAQVCGDVGRLKTCWPLQDTRPCFVPPRPPHRGTCHQGEEL